MVDNIRNKVLPFILVAVLAAILLAGCGRDGKTETAADSVESVTESTVDADGESDPENASESVDAPENDISVGMGAYGEDEPGSLTGQEESADPSVEAADNAEANAETEATADADVGPEAEETDAADNESSEKQSSGQVLAVAAKGSSAVVTLYEIYSDGSREKIYSADASIGKNGIGKTKEGDKKTPKGKYHFTMAFGTGDDPGSLISYTKVDDTYYWVDDSASKYYNRFVTTKNVDKDWNSAEHLTGAGASYKYAMALNYNVDCVPGKGSAIFMHCLPTGGAGCIAVKESAMKFFLTNVRPECQIIIDSADDLTF